MKSLQKALRVELPIESKNNLAPLMNGSTQITRTNDSMPLRVSGSNLEDAQVNFLREIHIVHFAKRR